MRVIIEDGYDGLHEELQVEHGKLIHFNSPQYSRYDMFHPIHPSAAPPLLIKAIARAHRRIAQAHAELAACLAFQQHVTEM